MNEFINTFNLNVIKWEKSNGKKRLHRPGIEPGPPAWQARILPLNHRCLQVMQSLIKDKVKAMTRQFHQVIPWAISYAVRIMKPPLKLHLIFSKSVQTENGMNNPQQTKILEISAIIYVKTLNKLYQTCYLTQR